MKKISFLVFVLGVNFCLNAQNEPKIGSIVFESCKYIGNKHLAPSELEKKEEKERLKAFVKENINAKKPDEFINSMPKTYTQTYGDSLKCEHRLDIYKETYESKVTCSYVEKTNIERYEQINRKNLKANTIERDTNTNVIKILPKRQIKLYSTANRYDLIEYRDQTKIILGYKCFKIELKKKLQKNSHLTTYDYEMYVTEEIDLNYNPISRDKNILEKYYPLQIIKKPRQEIMAEVTVWEVKQIDLKKL